MKKSIFILLLIVSFACERNYTYVELVNNGSLVSNEKTSFKSKNDSSAYVYSFTKFSSKLTAESLMRKGNTEISGIVGFMLLDDKENIIKNPFKDKSKFNTKYYLISSFLMLKPDSIAKLKMDRFNEFENNLE